MDETSKIPAVRITLDDLRSALVFALSIKRTLRDNAIGFCAEGSKLHIFSSDGSRCCLASRKIHDSLEEPITWHVTVPETVKMLKLIESESKRTHMRFDIVWIKVEEKQIVIGQIAILRDCYSYGSTLDIVREYRDKGVDTHFITAPIREWLPVLKAAKLTARNECGKNANRKEVVKHIASFIRSDSESMCIKTEVGRTHTFARYDVQTIQPSSDDTFDVMYDVAFMADCFQVLDKLDYGMAYLALGRKDKSGFPAAAVIVTQPEETEYGNNTMLLMPMSE